MAEVVRASQSVAHYLVMNTLVGAHSLVAVHSQLVDNQSYQAVHSQEEHHGDLVDHARYSRSLHKAAYGLA